MSNLKQTLMELCRIDGVSGREDKVRAYLISQLQNSPAEPQITVDPLGNILCSLRGRSRPSYRLMLAAHMDEVGFIITRIHENGYLHFATVGGINRSILCGRRVRIGEQVGVIGCKAIHLCSKKEKDVLPESADLLIDIGADSRAEAEKLVSPGDVATFDTGCEEMQDLLIGKALDDRAGCALLLQLAQEIPPYDITLAFTVQEEIGLRGAGPAAFSVQPDIAVIVDATTAADTADVPEGKQVCCVGHGPVVSFMDKSTLYDHALYRSVREIAESLHIPHQTKTTIVGGNDAGAIQRTAGGVKVTAVSLPCRYIHSPSCVLSMQDMEHTQALLTKLIGELPR